MIDFAPVDAAVFAAFADTPVSVGDSSFAVILDRGVVLRGEYGEVVGRETRVTARLSDYPVALGTVLVGETERYTIIKVAANDGALVSATVRVDAITTSFTFDSTLITFDSTQYTFDQT